MDLLGLLYSEPARYRLQAPFTDDIRQEVAVKYWRVEGGSSIHCPEAYLRKIINNVTIDAARADRRQPVSRDVLDDDEPVAVGAKHLSEDISTHIDLRLDVDCAIQRLPHMQRDVMDLVLAGLSHGDIAEILRISESTVRKNKSRAQQAMRTLLQAWSP